MKPTWTALSPPKRGAVVGLAPDDKGTKVMAVTDGAGIPFDALVDSAQKAQVHFRRGVEWILALQSKNGG